MSRKCEICGKGQVSGNAVSHSNRHTRRKWNANIQTVRVAEENGTDISAIRVVSFKKL